MELRQHRRDLRKRAGRRSLIYANVLLRKDEEWFVREEPGHGSWKDGHEYWPVTRADLDPHYDCVERMMTVQKYPLDQAPYDKTLKTLAFRDAAQKLGLDWNLVNLAVTFANDGDPAMVGEPIKEARPNIHGRTRLTCKLTGECDLGCNHGSKNSLDYTYITAAWHAGADIRTRHEVRSFEPREGGGYTLDYVIHDEASEGTRTDTSRLDRHTVSCDRLILSAGTLGTTYLLLKNRAAFPAISRALGTRFGGNGDLLTFARHCTTDGPDGRKTPTSWTRRTRRSSRARSGCPTRWTPTAWRASAASTSRTPASPSSCPGCCSRRPRRRVRCCSCTASACARRSGARHPAHARRGARRRRI